MSPIETKVRQARFRLSINQWLDQLCIALASAAGMFAAVVLVVRLLGWSWPLGITAAGLGAAATIVSVVWASATRVNLARAAAALDEAAGLKERISSGLYCQESDDPFGRAVVADAERTGTNLTVGAHLKWQVPRRLGSSFVVLILSSATLLVPSGLLARTDEKQAADAAVAEHTAAVVRRQSEQIKRVVKNNPELKTLADELDKLGEPPGDRMLPGAELKQAALKKLDAIKDVLKQQQGNDKARDNEEFKKMLRGLQTPQPPTTPAERLAKALASGDFKAAKEQIDTLREQLAKMSSPQDAQKLQELERQLAELSKKLDWVADDKKLAEKLQQGGIDKKDLERLLRQPSKKDLDQLRQQLEKQGLTQKDINELLERLQKKAGAGAMAKQLSQSLQDAAKSAGEGSVGEALDQLGDASDQLSEMEMLEQEMGQVDSMLAELQGAMNELGNPCSSCQGRG